MKRLLLCILPILLLGGCVTVFRPTDKLLVTAYSVAADESYARIAEDATLPTWVQQSAHADMCALRSIRGMAEGKKVEELCPVLIDDLIAQLQALRAAHPSEVVK